MEMKVKTNQNGKKLKLKSSNSTGIRTRMASWMLRSNVQKGSSLTSYIGSDRIQKNESLAVLA
ncbi:unnamed protein product [Nesidiocoris tenuis]|uniref:Uncharacterized protein n=1 Tax=Nesidiocoris tenuis TaxID=355587 RepID=A0A6H5H6Z8_9HEMI|nr:unnamed protein product [Nesidiocoris tenuis]